MTSDPYAWLKAVHVAAAMLFVGGVMSVAVFQRGAAPADVETAREVRRWDQLLTTPAMLLVWMFGLPLGLWGGWFHDSWLIAKIGFVALLSTLHGIQSGKLRRMARGGSTGLAPGRNVALVPFVVIAIVFLVVVKPF